MNAAARSVVACLASLALALLFVGGVSGTVLRHVVQIVPVVAALLITVRRPALGASAALPLFAFWMLIVALIWMFLLGVSSIANGTYTFAEIGATFVMFSCSIVGLTSTVPLSRGVSLGRRIALVAVFAALQIAVMAVSMMRGIANR